MDGLGFLIWQLVLLPPIDALIKLLKSVGVHWLSFKIADGEYSFNQIGGNDKILRDGYIKPLQDAGFKVGGWHYVYPSKPSAQAGKAAERIQKLDLAFYQIDAESEWKIQGGKKAAETFIAALAGEVNQKYHVSLCSYRFPALHTDFPWGGWLHNATVKSVSPQVYWLGSHNPVEQVVRSEAEYRTFNLPFYPIGATFAQSKPGGQGYWEPTGDDFRAFSKYCARYPGYSFYTLDWLLEHNRTDWLTAIAGAPVEPPPEPEPKQVRVKVAKTNIRNKPVVSTKTDFGDLQAGGIMTVLDETSDGKWLRVEGFVSKANTEVVTS